MIQKFLLLSVWIILLLSTTKIVQAQINTCRLSYSLVDKKSGTLSSNYGVGTFTFDAKDEEVIKFFKDEKSGIKIWVGAQIYGSRAKKVPKQMDIAIAFGNINPETTELFRYADSAIAEIIYDKKTRFVSVSKTIETNDEIYRFRFNCARNK